MQTSQVSNAANVLANPAPPAKSGEASSSAPFEQVLSREIAGRGNAKEAAASKDASKSDAAKPREPAVAAKDRQNAEAETEASEATDSGGSTDAAAAAAQAPEDMLALVANLAQLAAPATGTQAAAQDTGAAAGAAAGNNIGAALAAATSSAAQRKAGAMPDALTGQADALAARMEAGGGTSGTAAAELNGKGMQAAGAAIAASADAMDFSAVMKESLSGLGAATQQIHTIQPGAVQGAQQLAASAAEKLSPRVGTPAWDQALGQKVIWMVAGEQQSASLTLNPPDLGPLQVALSVSNSQASATFSAAQPEVRQALEAALPKLREMLGEAGIQLGHASVNSGSQNQQGSEQQATQHGHRLGQADGGGETQVHVSRVPVPSAGRGMVDTFV